MTTRATQIECLLTPVIDHRTTSVASGYTAYFYAAGTSTPKNVWTEKEKTNPYTSRTLGSDGTVQVYGDGVYKIDIKDSNGTSIWENGKDNIKVQANTFTVQTKADTYTATADDDLILAGGTFTVNLATVTGFTHPLIIKRTSGTITVDPYSTETIDGSSTITLTAEDDSAVLYPDISAGIWRRADRLSGLTATTTALNTAATYVGNLSLAAADVNAIPFGTLKRSIFTYNGGATAYTVKAKAGFYYVKDKVAKWTSELTTSAIGTPSADTHYYLYLDYSAITSATAITANELIWSSTAPTYSATYGGWYNGDDLCIFSALTNSGPSNIEQFYNDGGNFVQYVVNGIEDLKIATAVVPNGTFTDVDASGAVPGFCTRAHVLHVGSYVDTPSVLAIRPNGSSGAGIYVTAVSATTPTLYTPMVAMLDSSQIYEVHMDTSSNTYNAYALGWYFPSGM